MRHFWVFLILASLVLAACGADDTTDGEPVGTDSDQSPVTDDSAVHPDQERPSITVASAWLPATLDPVQDGYSLIQRGVGETLIRVGHDQSIEPWLAESVELVEGPTWEIILREDVTFWNGETLTSQHVVDAIERNWAEQPAAASFLPDTSELEIVDDLTLRLTLPAPDSSLPHNLAVPQLVIHTMEDDEAVMTGPYRAAALRGDEELVLESFDGYWGKTPPFAQITVQRVSDGNARELAVQAGDVDIITEASPESAAAASGDVASHSVDSTRVHHMIVNHQQAPFDDPAVREAVNRAVNRKELNEVALGGLGLGTTTIIPPGIGIDTPEQLEIDTAAAEAVLDDAGWAMGDGGVRVKDGQPLEFQLLSYPGRPELTPMAVSIQDQLGRIGFDVSVQEVDDIVDAIDGTDFQASIFSMNMLPNGDPVYALQTSAASDGGNNYGNYGNPEFDELLANIRAAELGDERDELIMQGQQMLLDDHAVVYLISAPRAVIYRPDTLEQPDLHPSEMYFIHTDLRPVAE